MHDFIAHPFVGQILIFNPANLDKEDFRFYKEGHYFDYTYYVDSAVLSSTRKHNVILQTRIHEKIAGEKRTSCIRFIPTEQKEN